MKTKEFMFLTLAFLMISGLGFTGFYLYKIQKVEIQNIMKKQDAIEKKIGRLESYLRELEASDAIDKQDIHHIWESLAIVRNNFMAIGHGYHLDEKDFCPPNVCKPCESCEPEEIDHDKSFDEFLLTYPKHHWLHNYDFPRLE